MSVLRKPSIPCYIVIFLFKRLLTLNRDTYFHEPRRFYGCVWSTIHLFESFKCCNKKSTLLAVGYGRGGVHPSGLTILVYTALWVWFMAGKGYSLLVWLYRYTLPFGYGLWQGRGTPFWFDYTGIHCPLGMVYGRGGVLPSALTIRVYTALWVWFMAEEGYSPLLWLYGYTPPFGYGLWQGRSTPLCIDYTGIHRPLGMVYGRGGVLLFALTIRVYTALWVWFMAGEGYTPLLWLYGYTPPFGYGLWQGRGTSFWFDYTGIHCPLGMVYGRGGVLPSFLTIRVYTALWVWFMVGKGYSLLVWLYGYTLPFGYGLWQGRGTPFWFDYTGIHCPLGMVYGRGGVLPSALTIRVYTALWVWFMAGKGYSPLLWLYGYTPPFGYGLWQGGVLPSFLTIRVYTALGVWFSGLLIDISAEWVVWKRKTTSMAITKNMWTLRIFLIFSGRVWRRWIVRLGRFQHIRQ